MPFTWTNLIDLFRQFHVVKDAEDDAEEVTPPVTLEGLPISFHDLKHHSQTPGTQPTQTLLHMLWESAVFILTVQPR